MGNFPQLVVRHIFTFFSCLALSNIIHAAPFSATVTDYGPLALPDTQHDDTQAVQEAINEAQLHGGIVFFPAGTYNVKSLKVDSSVTLMGEGAGSVIKQLDSESRHNVLNMELKKDGVRVYIDLLTFDGNSSNVDRENAIIDVYAEGTRQSNVALEVSRTMFVNQAYVSLRFRGSIEDIGDEYLKVRDCIFQRGNAGGIDYDPRYIDVWRGAQIVITDNLFDFINRINHTPPDYEVGISAIIIAGTKDDGYRDLFSSAIIRGNVFRRLGRKESTLPDYNEGGDLGVIDFYRRGDNIIISNNTFENSTHTAVRGKSDVRRLLVVNNLIDKANGLGVYITPIHDNILNSGEIIVEGNIIKEVHGGIYLEGNGGRKDDSDDMDWLWNVSIRGNIIAIASNPTWGSGIRLRRIFSFDILHNRISDTILHSILVEPSIGSGNISQNMIFGSKQDGIRVKPPSEGKELRINFLGNHIEDTKDSGITAQKITVANIQGNHIHRARIAIELYSITNFAKVNDNIATNVGTYLSKSPPFQTVDEKDNSWR